LHDFAIEERICLSFVFEPEEKETSLLTFFLCSSPDNTEMLIASDGSSKQEEK